MKIILRIVLSSLAGAIFCGAFSYFWTLFCFYLTEENRNFFDKEFTVYVVIFVVPLTAFIGLIIGLLVGTGGTFIESRIIYALASALVGAIIGLLSFLLLAAAIASIGRPATDEFWLPSLAEMFTLGIYLILILAAVIFPFALNGFVVSCLNILIFGTKQTAG